MAEKASLTRRDSALVSILGRMSEQLQKQDQILDDIVKSQLELSKALETKELSAGSRVSEVDTALKKMHDSFSRYRSDMLSLVNEQDHMNKNMVSFNTLLNKATYAMEKANQMIAALDERVRNQEKSVSEHYTHSLKQAEILPKEIADSYRSVAKLHMDTEKNLGRMHHETQRQLEKLQQETTRRLLVLGDIESAVQTLLIRTEPPEKKTFWLIRLFRRAGVFLRGRLSRLSRVKRPQRKK